MAERTPADIAAALERRPARRLARAATRLAERLVGREGPSRLPHALTWRLRGRIWRTRSIEVFPGRQRSQPQDRAGDRRRLLLVSNDLSLSGAPQLVVEMAQLLAEGGAAVTVASPSDGPQRGVLTAAGVTVIVDPSLDQANPALMRAVAPVIDAAICNTVATAPSVEVLTPAVPVIWYIHEVSLLAEMLAADTGLDRSLSLPARLWTGSELPATLLRPYRSDVAVVPYGVDRLPTDGQVRAVAADRPLRLSVLASIESRKGQDLLLDALTRLAPEVRDQLRVALYGRTLEREFGDALAVQAATLPQVTIGGALDRDGYRAAMLAADAIVIPSRDDTLPLTSLDALGSGRVLICTATTGTARYLTSGVDGFVAAEPTAEAIAATLTEAITRAGDWPVIAAAGQATFARVFSRAAFAARIGAELDAIVPAGAA